MYRTSEYVSTGHPDKVADYLSCFSLDRFLEKDPMTRYALEVMIKSISLNRSNLSQNNYACRQLKKRQIG